MSVESVHVGARARRRLTSVPRGALPFERSAFASSTRLRGACGASRGVPAHSPREHTHLIFDGWNRLGLKMFFN